MIRIKIFFGPSTSEQSKIPSLVKMMQDIGQYPVKFAPVDKPKKNLIIIIISVSIIDKTQNQSTNIDRLNKSI